MSLTYEVGQTITWGLTVYDTAGVLADLGGGNPTAQVTLPDGTTAAATVAKSSTGTYTAQHVATTEGRYRVRWSGTGTNSGGLPYGDLADVLPADPRFIVSLADARAGLNLAAGQRVNDDELRGYLAAATVVVEFLAGPQLTATRTETHSGNGRSAILLNDYPTTVTTVTEDGVTLSAGMWCWDESGILWRGSTKNAGYWSNLTPRNVVVTYSVGGILPPNVRLAARELVAHWYRQGQQPWRQPYPSGNDEFSTVMVAGYAVPNAVVDKLAASDNRTPGLA